MQSLFSLFGLPAESQSVGPQNHQQPALFKNDETNWQQKAAAFLKILSDCSPESKLDAVSLETSNQAGMISPDVVAKMSGLISPKSIYDIPQEPNGISINHSVAKNTEMKQKSDSEAHQLLTSLLLNIKHGLRSEIRPDEKTDADTVAADETAIEDGSYPFPLSSTSESVPEQALSISLPEKPSSSSIDEGIPLQDTDKRMVTESPSNPILNTINNTDKIQPQSIPTQVTKQTIEQYPVSEAMTDFDIQETDGAIKTRTAISGTFTTSHIDSGKENIRQQNNRQQQDGIERSINQNMSYKISSEDKTDHQTTNFKASVLTTIVGDKTRTGTGLSIETEDHARQPVTAPSSVLTSKVYNEKQSGIHIGDENQAKSKDMADVQLSAAKTSVESKIQFGIGDLNEKGAKDSPANLNSAKDAHENQFRMETYSKGEFGSEKNGQGSQEKNNSGQGGQKQKQLNINKDNGLIANKNQPDRPQPVFQKLNDNDVPTAASAAKADGDEQSSSESTQANSFVTKQPNKPQPSYIMSQNQNENRVQMSSGQTQHVDLNTALDTDKNNTKVGGEKNDGIQMDQIRSGNPAEDRTAVIRQIVQHMNYRQFGSRSQMVVHLKPESLGRLRMQIETDNQQVTVKMISDSNNVKEMIEQHLHTLKHELKEHGLEVHKIDVSVHSENEQQRNGQPSGSFNQTAQQKANQQKQQQMSQEENSSGKDNASMTDTSRVDTSANTNENNEVDYFA